MELSQREIAVSVFTLKTMFVLLLLQMTFSPKFPLHRNVQTVAEDESMDPSRTVSFVLMQPAAGDSEKVIKQGKNIVTGVKRGDRHRDHYFPAPEGLPLYLIAFHGFFLN